MENAIEPRNLGHYRQQQSIQGTSSMLQQYAQTKSSMPNVVQAPQFYQYSQTPAASSAANLKFNSSGSSGALGDRRGSAQPHTYSNSNQVYGRLVDPNQQMYMNTANTSKPTQYSDNNYYKTS